MLSHIIRSHSIQNGNCRQFVLSSSVSAFQTTPCKHPVIVLRDIIFSDLVALIEFIYQGEVRVDRDRLPSFLRTAEVLRVRGLTEEASKLKSSQLAYDSPKPLIQYNHGASTATFSPRLFQYGPAVQVCCKSLPILHSKVDE